MVLKPISLEDEEGTQTKLLQICFETTEKTGYELLGKSNSMSLFNLFGVLYPHTKWTCEEENSA